MCWSSDLFYRGSAGPFSFSQFFLPYLLSNEIATVQLGMLLLRGQYGTQWGLVFAGVLLAALPLLIAYVALTRHFIAGLTSGALKG